MAGTHTEKVPGVNDSERQEGETLTFKGKTWEELSDDEKRESIIWAQSIAFGHPLFMRATDWLLRNLPWKDKTIICAGYEQGEKDAQKAYDEMALEFLKKLNEVEKVKPRFRILWLSRSGEHYTHGNLQGKTIMCIPSKLLQQGQTYYTTERYYR